MSYRLELVTVATPAAAAERSLAELEASLRREPQGLISFASGRTFAPFFAGLERLLSREPALADRLRATHLDELVGFEPETPGGMAAEIFSACEPLRRAWREGRFLAVPGTPDPAALAAHQARLAAAGGVALQFLGLGRNGHLAFNEPGTPWELGFHVAALAAETRADLAGRFGPSRGPERAATAGLRSILSARSIVLVATGASKRPAVERLFSGEVSGGLPASCLRGHPSVRVILDADAAPRVP